MSYSMKSLWCVHAPWRGYDTFWDDFVCEKMQTRSRSPTGCSPVSPGLSAGLKLLHWFSFTYLSGLNCENYAADFRILHCLPWCTQHLCAVQCTALTAVTFQWALKSRVWTRHLVFFTIALSTLASDFSTCQLLQVSDQIISSLCVHMHVYVCTGVCVMCKCVLHTMVHIWKSEDNLKQVEPPWCQLQMQKRLLLLWMPTVWQILTHPHTPHLSLR